jgi:hypothetical protein
MSGFEGRNKIAEGFRVRVIAVCESANDTITVYTDSFMAWSLLRASPGIELIKSSSSSHTNC